MLKNKKAIYILIPVNLLVWGFFIYRFWSAYNIADAPAGIPKLQAIKLADLKDSVTYTLQLDYKDPFLKDAGKISGNANAGNNINSVAPQKQVAAVKMPASAPKMLPDIKYMGLIKNNSSGIATALISVNGQSRLIKQNETHDGILFKNFNKDSLVAKWGKEKIVVRK